MKRTIEIEFSEEAPVEIPALTASVRTAEANGAHHFWLGWQLFGAERVE